MAEDKPRLARLSAILTRLQSKKIVTATEIADKHHVSIRTVYRDIRTLLESGIPIQTIEGKGYSIIDGFHLPPVMFSEEEALAMITAEKLIQKNSDSSLIDNYERAVTKIKAVLKSKDKRKAEFLNHRLQVRSSETSDQTSPHLIQLQSMIANFQVIEIIYHSLNNYESQRRVEPFALLTTNGNWILIAFCRLKNDFRSFRLDCIKVLKVTTEFFKPHDITLEQYFESCRKKWQSTPDTPLS